MLYIAQLNEYMKKTLIFIRAKIEYILFRTGFFISFLIKLRCRIPIFRKRKIVKIKPLSEIHQKNVYEGASPNDKVHSLVIFAAYFPDGIIPKHTIYCLSQLKKYYDGIILISDSFLPLPEIDKIKHLVIYCECCEHCEYDFGSYKRGYNYAKDAGMLKGINNLLLCNDSVAGPIFDLKNTFNKMSNKTDFWGLMDSKEIRYHLQSWFMCFENTKLINNEVGMFLNKVIKEKYFWDIVLNYETKFTKYLIRKGYTCASYTPNKINETKKMEVLNHSSNKVFYPFTMMSKFSFPFVKIKYLKGDYDDRLIESKEKTLQYIKKNNYELYAILKEEFF